jgi:hypothetical protein
MDTTKDDDSAVAGDGSDPQAEFPRRLLACWRGIDTLVLGLAERYDLMVILSALAEHTGIGLLALMKSRKGGALHALYLINRMEGRAFPDSEGEQHHEG